MSKKSFDDDEVFRGADRLVLAARAIGFLGFVIGIFQMTATVENCDAAKSYGKCSFIEEYPLFFTGVITIGFAAIIFILFMAAAGYLRSQIKYQNSNLNLQSEINDKLSQIMDLPEGNGSSEPKRLDQTPSEQSSEGAIPYSEDQYLSYKERERDLKSWTQDMLNKSDDDD